MVRITSPGMGLWESLRAAAVLSPQVGYNLVCVLTCMCVCVFCRETLWDWQSLRSVWIVRAAKGPHWCSESRFKSDLQLLVSFSVCCEPGGFTHFFLTRTEHVWFQTLILPVSRILGESESLNAPCPWEVESHDDDALNCYPVAWQTANWGYMAGPVSVWSWTAAHSDLGFDLGIAETFASEMFSKVLKLTQC